MTVKAESYFLMAILVAMLAAAAAIMNFSFWQAKLAPLSVVVLILILGALQLKKEISASKAGKPAVLSGDVDSTRTPAGSARAYLIEGAWMSGCVAAIYLFGLLAGIVLFGVAYMKTHGASLAKSVLVTACIAFSCYAVFSYVLDVEFYPGLVFDALSE